MRDDVKMLRYRDQKAVFERRWDGFQRHDGDIDEALGAINAGLEAVKLRSELREDAHRRELAKAREQLDERGGHIEAMDISGLVTAKNVGLVSKKAHDAERARRAADFSVKELPRRAVEFETGAVVSGILLCGYGDCMRLVDLSKGSSYCTEHAKNIRAPRQYISGAMSVQDLDHQLELAEQVHADATRRLADADRQLAGVREKVKAFDAQHGA
jgi:hypothetical protein